MATISLADAKARLSQLIDQVEGGATVEITRRGKRVARLTSVAPPRKAVDAALLQRLTSELAVQTQQAEDLVRSMRDDRY